MFTSSCLFYCEMCHGLKLPVYCYTRAQITTVKFLMNSVNTPASCLYDIFLKISLRLLYRPFNSTMRGSIWGFEQITGILQECTFKVMVKSQVAVKALLRKVGEKKCLGTLYLLTC